MTTVGKLQEKERKKERMAHANDVIRAISKHGRRFFYSEKNDAIASFQFDPQGRLCYRDEYFQKTFIVHIGKRWTTTFSNGGTLKRLVEALAIYIRTGNPIPCGHFGHWDGSDAQNDLWAYGSDAMNEVRSEVSANLAVAPRQKEIRNAA